MITKTDFEWISSMITEQSVSEAEARSVVQRLAEIDWGLAISKKISKSNRVSKKGCSRCYKPVDKSEMQIDKTMPEQYRRLCLDCHSYLRSELSCLCMLCKTRFKEPRNGNPNPADVCPQCFPPYAKEWRRISNQLSRARSMELPATLRLSQWITTLEHFNWMCAYCRGGFELLDHFVPLGLKGGTTVDNCVPSCRACNDKKTGDHPDEVVAIPRKDLKRVSTYLASQRELAIATPEHKLKRNPILKKGWDKDLSFKNY